MSWWRKLFGGDPARGDAVSPTATSPATPSPSPRSAAGRPAPVPAAGAAPPTRVLGVTPSGVEVRGFEAPAEELMGWWHRLRADHATTGLWPVLLGTELGDLAAALTPESRDTYDDAAQLARAATMTMGDLEALRAQRHARYADDDDTDDAPSDDDLPPVVRRNPAAFSAAQEDGLVALVPAAHGWQVPVILGWEGGVNYDVEPVDHGVVLRDWSERFGAELVTLTSDQVLEVLVARPPVTPAQALEVAREQYAYCPDLVDQGVGSLQVLAQDYTGAGSWAFWWD